MRQQRIRRIMDARKTQQCVIVALTCGHNQRVTEREMLATPVPLNLTPGALFNCDACPDAAPEKSATQLYREAGEP